MTTRRSSHTDAPAPPPFDAARLGARLLRPARPTLGAARALVRESEDPREAWERAAAQALIAPAWEHLCPPLEDDPIGLERDHPPTLAHLCMFAADAAALETVHALARTLITALSAWDVCDRGARFAWKIADRSSWTPAGLHPLVLMHSRVAMPKASLFDGVRLSFLAASRDCAGARHVADTLRFAALWRAAASLFEGVKEVPFARALAPKGYDPDAQWTWPDPWTPLAEIVALGYAVHRYERGQIVLVAPQP